MSSWKNVLGKKPSLFILLCLMTHCLIGSTAFRREKFIKVYLPDAATVTAELAVTDEERQQGLMFRERLGLNLGMLFIFEEESIHSFWMKNMRFSIDILWLDKEKRIVHIEESVPPCPGDPCPSYTPKNSAAYVLELESGMAERHKLKLNERLDFILPQNFKSALIRRF